MQFSIVITTKNRKDSVCLLIHNLLAQSYSRRDIEIIVVDNDSTDGTVALLKRTFRRSIRVYTEHRTGPSFCRNTGYRAARYGTVIFLDDDIRVSHSFLSSFAAAWKRFPDAGLIGSKIQCMFTSQVPNNALISRLLKRFGWVFAHQDFGTRPFSLPYGSFLLSACMSIRKGATHTDEPLFLEKLGREYGGVLLFGEDYELCNRTIALGKRVIYVPTISVQHRTQSSRLTTRYILSRHTMAGITSYLEDAFLWKYPSYRSRTKWYGFLKSVGTGRLPTVDTFSLSFAMGYVLLGPLFFLVSLGY